MDIECMCENCKKSFISEEFLGMIITVVSGVLVFVICQLFIEYFLKPIQDYKKLRAKISYTLTYYADLYMNPIKSENDKDKFWECGSQNMRELSAEVRSFIELRPFGNIFIPKKKKLVDVAENLMGLSNNFFNNQNTDIYRLNNEYQNQIYKILKIKTK